ncbi:MAG: sporulation protein YqfD, partial [Clostridia bacterium]|nr:sporulation protein YqfD [Clostridia bacterium]
MFIINLYRFLCGYVEILVIGEFCSKLLNIFALQKISIWDIETKENRIKFCVSVKDFLRLREVKGKLSFKVKILKKCGLPFVVKKRVKRIGVVLGIALFFITLQFLSNYIWTVRVEGNAVIAKEEIVACCEKIGVRSGMRRSEVDSGYLRERLLLECDELAWCSFNVEDSRLTVNVTEISSPSNLQPSNIVSDFDGVITEIFVESGTALVKKSDAVRKGDVLISG